MLHSPLMMVSLDKLSRSLGLLLIAVLVYIHSSTSTAQPSINATISIQQTDTGLYIEWELPADLVEDIETAMKGDVDTDQPSENGPLSLLQESGWAIDLLDHIEIPGYTIPAVENSTDTDGAESSNAEIISSIDIEDEMPWTHPIEKKKMPNLVGPSGEVRRYVGPSELAEELVPTEPVYLLREGIQRGTRSFVVAVSPIYRDGERLRLVTKGRATLEGIKQGRATLDPLSPSIQTFPSLPTDSQESEEQKSLQLTEKRIPLESPLAQPATDTVQESRNLPLQSPLALPGLDTSQELEDSPLESPLALPEDESKRGVQVSPLDTPVSTRTRTPTAVPTEKPTEKPTSTPTRTPAETSTPTATVSPTAVSTPTPEAIATETLVPETLVPETLVPDAAEVQKQGANAPEEAQPFLESPLAQPNPEQGEGVMTSPLVTPTDLVMINPTPVATPTNAEPLPETDAATAELEVNADSEIKVDTTEMDTADSTIAPGASQTSMPVTPWTGLLTFALFGVGLIVVLFSNNE